MQRNVEIKTIIVAARIEPFLRKYFNLEDGHKVDVEIVQLSGEDATRILVHLLVDGTSRAWISGLGLTAAGASDADNVTVEVFGPRTRLNMGSIRRLYNLLPHRCGHCHIPEQPTMWINTGLGDEVGSLEFGDPQKKAMDSYETFKAVS